MAPTPPKPRLRQTDYPPCNERKFGFRENSEVQNVRRNKKAYAEITQAECYILSYTDFPVLHKPFTSRGLQMKRVKGIEPSFRYTSVNRLGLL